MDVRLGEGLYQSTVLAAATANIVSPEQSLITEGAQMVEMQIKLAGIWIALMLTYLLGVGLLINALTVYVAWTWRS